jgi:hypothetical protein
VTVVALAARAAHLLFIWDHPFRDFWTVWNNSDMHQYVAWGRHLAGGDWLDADTFRPWFTWQEGIAPPEVWNAWFGAHVYYQPPVYPYLLAVFINLTGGVDLFRACQIVLGAVNCGLIALLGGRLFGRTEGWIAGLAAALYAPFILYDAEFLRGTVVMTTQLALLLALAARRAAWAGVALGLSYLAEPSILLFAPPASLWLWWRSRWRPALIFVSCAALSLLPLVARNALVGAPLLSSTTRGPLAFVMGNAPDAQPAGALIPDSTGAILRRSGYSMMGTITETLRLYDGRYGALAAKQWEKLRALWGSFEVPDNPSFYYAARISPAVRFGLRFLPVAALGLVGLGFALPGIAREPGRLLLVLFLLSFHALFLLAHVVSRYRQAMVMALLIFGAHAVARAIERDAGTVRRLAVPAAAALVALILPWSPPAGYGYLRAAEYIVASDLYVERGRPDQGIVELRSLIEQGRGDPGVQAAGSVVHYKLGRMLAATGNHAEAAASFREALAMDPTYGEAAEALEASEAALRRQGKTP